MKIIGRGFVAQNLQAYRPRHPGTVVMATGVATTMATSQDAYERDAQILYDAIDYCRRADERLLYLSTASAAMYGAPNGTTSEDGPVFPPLPYGRHKLAMEAVVARSGVDHLILRITNLVGRAQRSHQLLPSLIDQIRSGQVELYEGAQRDLLDMAHAAEMIDLLLSSARSGEVINLGSGVFVPIEQIVDRIESRLGLRAVRRICRQAKPPVSQPVSIEKLKQLIPGVEQRFGLGPDYFTGVIDRYVESLLTV